MEPLGSRPILIEQAYKAILEAIADGRFAPGERLAQETLAEQLRVSRQPISHALALLKQEGFVVEAGRRGVVVAPLDPDYLRALYQVRAALDAAAARLAAERVAAALAGERAWLDAELAAQATTLQRGLAAVAAHDRAELIAADLAFHQGINRLSGNPVIVETAERQWGHMRRAMGVVLAEHHQAVLAWQEHAAIHAAVAAGEAAAAEALARAHAERAGRSTYGRLVELAQPAAAAE